MRLGICSIQNRSNESALYTQLFLAEYLAFEKELSELTRLLKLKPSAKSDRAIVAALIELTGRLHTAHATPWNQEEGKLNKMKFYICLLLEEKENLKLLSIRQTIEMSWLTARAALDNLPRKNITDAQLKLVLISLKKIEESVAHFLMHTTFDANTLFFILRHQAHLSKIFGNSFLRKILLKSYPKGFQHFANSLVMSFKKRGFNNLETTIKTKADELFK